MLKLQQTGWTKLESPLSLQTSKGIIKAQYVLGQATSVVLLDPTRNLVIKIVPTAFTNNTAIEKYSFYAGKFLSEKGYQIPQFVDQLVIKRQKIPDDFLKQIDHPDWMKIKQFTITTKDYFSGLTTFNLYDQYGLDLKGHEYLDRQLKELWREMQQYFTSGEFRSWLEKKYPAQLSQLPAEQVQRGDFKYANFLYNRKDGWVLIDP